MRVLSVDDSAIIRKIIRNGVELLQFEMLEAANGAEAFQILEDPANEVHLILLDWNMPGMDGFEFLCKLKMTAAFCHIPVMMVTTESEEENIIKAIQAGAINYLVKPFTLKELMQKIGECLAAGPL